MPKIERQKPSDKRVRKKSGDILDQIVPVSEIGDDWVKLVLYGQNRTGKTTLAGCFPKPSLMVAFEPTKTGGSRSVRNVTGLSHIRIADSKSAIELANRLKDSPGKFKTVILDSVTSYQDIILREILDLPDVPEQLNWGMVSRDQYRERSEKTREALRPFLALECNVICNAKERDHNPPDKEKPAILRKEQLESFFAADLGGATVGWLHDACDYIGRLYIEKEVVTRKEKVKRLGKIVEREVSEETGKLVRRLRTMYHPNYAAGFRSESPESVPEFIEAVTPQEMYEKIMQVIRGEYRP